MSDLPRHTVARTARLASLPIGIAGRTALGLGKRLGGKPAEVVLSEAQRRTADQLFKVLGELKGGAMKFGQALSIFEAALPEHLAGPYRATLTKLQDSAPPMSADRVHKVLDRELGPHWRRRLRNFDDEPAASASIGQVHRAQWPGGREVAVKIQYPGAAEALRSDLNQIALLSRLFTTWMPGLEVKPLVAELKARIGEELDYSLEAEAQERFATAYDGDADFAIPHVRLHTQHVLVTDWLDGTPLSQVIAHGTQEERDRAGLLFVRFLFSGPARAGLLHADPHPGNYRITPDGRLGVLDFGLVARLPGGFPPQIGRLLRIGLNGDAENILEGLRAEGFVKPHIDLDADELYSYLQPFTEPARHETFQFSREWMRSQFQRITDVRSTSAKTAFKLNLPPSYALIHRVWSGGIGVLAQLGTEAPFRAEFERWLPGFTDEPVIGASDGQASPAPTP
ncbi:ABC1 kinase family protein [Actinopolymorpha singaporensis]|uniref:Predicted unusual protein kinase regulating ubiquinone biosynthesis, AarF/ABC1/UbiB family n=1 Tax=Actinopolymorpha singaporensis TaxID=117157 RepID=A0A1H1YPR7_9ACTN|nr:AarF/ABC1/UbiB kinase family protein [Actinopolymorpha singaporensis]SDT23475.1 Predicted unusual protein kinase regulating ubiquinone biosynthesis, AarF/ABC1/UbiB family [Actinopolymorpha singaporensis]